MYSFVNWFNNFQTRYRLKKFIIPIVLVLTIIFLPDDVFARTEVRLLKADYGEVARCVDQECINGTFYADIGPVHRIMIVQDGYSIPANMKYKWYLDFSLSYTPSRLSSLGVRVGQSGNTWMTPTWNYEVVNSYFDSVYGSPTNRYHVNATFTTLNQGDTIYTDIDLGEDIWVYNFTLYAWRLTALGSETNDIIFNQTQELIDNQNKNQQETNDRLDKIDDTLNDDDVSSSESEISSFFDNFNLKDNGGISGVIILPLRVIEGLVSGGTCSNLEFSIFGKDVYFPSGCILWSNAPSSIVLIYQTLICGLFGYILCIRLFKDVESLKNPNDSGVSTLDL